MSHSSVAMFVSRVLYPATRVVSASQTPQHLRFLGLQSSDNLNPVTVNLLHQTANSSSTPRASFFSSTFTKHHEKKHGNNGSFTSSDSTKASDEAKASGWTESSGLTKDAKQTKESGLESEVDPSMDVKVYATKNFAKRFMDVADNWRRTSLIGKNKFASKEFDGAVPLQKTLHECPEGAKKQLAQVQGTVSNSSIADNNRCGGSQLERG